MPTRFNLERDGVRLSGLDFGGAGSAVLLLHGLAGHAGEWADTAARLTEGNRVVALDMRGHGSSERDPSDVSQVAHAGDAALAVEALGLGPAVVVGQSLGGLTAMVLAAGRPELVRALVVADASPAAGDDSTLDEVGGALREWPVPFASREAALSYFGGSALRAEAWVDGLEHREDGLWPRFDAKVMVRTLGDALSRSYWTEWERIACPTLVLVAGKGDIPETETRAMTESLAQAVLAEIPDAEHDLHLDRPHEWRAALTEFLDSIDDEAEIYESDSAAQPDSDFEPALIAHLVVDNRGRLLDQRRTPVTITGVDLESGLFEVELPAFEDAGAKWRVPLEEVWRFQVARGSNHADGATIGTYEQVIERLDRPLTITCDPDVAARTSRRIASELVAARAALDGTGVPDSLDATDSIEQRRPDGSLIAAVRDLLTRRNLADMDEAFARGYVTNPWSGELVKGHAIVLAELGLCPYHGKVARDARLFRGKWSKERRGEHLIVRLALTQALWERTRSENVTLYRAISSHGREVAEPPTSFVSATFSRRVAEAHEKTVHMQRVPLRRLFMTFWETPAMSDRYREAEAILVGDPRGAGF